MSFYIYRLDEAKKKGFSNKFRKRWKEPYKVLEINDTGHVVKIKPANRNGKSIRVNISKLKTYYKRIIPRTENVHQELIEIKEEMNYRIVQTKDHECIKLRRNGRLRNKQKINI